jgi:MAF protein
MQQGAVSQAAAPCSFFFPNPIVCVTMTPAMRGLVLASQSPRRRELLALLGLPFDVAVADVAETPQPGESPTALVARLSRDKALAAHSGGIVVACDTVVALDGDVLGKPCDAREATAMLRRLRGRPHTVYSAITLLETTTTQTLTDVAETSVMMRAYTEAELAAYVASGDPLDKAGAYAIQHAGFHPVAHVQGCCANVTGLPLCHLTRCLRAWGIEPPNDVPVVCQAHTGYACPVHTIILGDQ